MSRHVEILWHFYCPNRKRHVEEWLPGTLIATRPGDGRHEVRTDCGKYAADAAPECVREVLPVAGDVVPFAAGRAYTCRSACDHACVWTFEVVRRTAKRLILRELGKQETVTVGIKIHDGRETCSPHGTFSMSPILRA